MKDIDKHIIYRETIFSKSLLDPNNRFVNPFRLHFMFNTIQFISFVKDSG